jgi:hypothetical protein
MSFPRPVSNTESQFIDWLLPDHSPVYSQTAEKIRSLEVVGEGRWGTGDLMIGTNASIDLTLGMTAVVAYGECLLGDQKLTISIHEPNIDDQIEVQFSMYPLPDNPQVTSGWTYSYWQPGMPCPKSGSPVREVAMHYTTGAPKYTLVFSPARKALWLFHHDTSFNELLPVTGFMDELLRTHNIREIETISKPSALFEQLDNYSDDDIRRAFWEYAQVANRKFDLSDVVIDESKSKPSLFKKLLGKK